MQLVRDPRQADLIVDASNVCSRDVLGGRRVSLERLEAAGDAFASWAGVSETQMFLVADNSLAMRLEDPTERKLLRNLAEDGRVEMLPGADERILDLVAITGIHAMTWDRFEGHRDSYPWLQGDREHFVLVRQGSQGLHIEPRDMGTVRASRVSERAEVDALKAARLLTPAGAPDVNVLSRWWVCPDRRCSLFPRRHDGGQPVPIRDRARLLCSLHRLELLDDGPRPRQVQVKVLVDGSERRRFLLNDGAAPVVVGRGPTAALDLDPLLAPGDRDLISRRHVSVALMPDGLAAQDLGSTNGTTLQQRARSKRLLDGDMTSWHPSHDLVLADLVTLQVSGRRFPVGLRQPPNSPAGPAGETRLA